QRTLISGVEHVFIYAEGGESWLTYKVDGEDIRRVILQDGRFLKLSGNFIRMFVGNLNVLKIFYQNQLIDAPSSSGVKSLVFPEARKSELSLPLFVFPGDGTTW